MANDINDTDVAADRGFMGGNWWRTPNNSSNARVQEHVSTLSWFYANQRPWNPYFQNAALLGRLDAAVLHYLSLQQTDGSFPEYSHTEHGLAQQASASATWPERCATCARSTCCPTGGRN